VIPASRQRNYLQSALYVAIVAILATILLNRLFTAAEYAEKAAMEISIGNLQSALYARLALLVLKGETGAIPDLEGHSPFLTANVSGGAAYAGEFYGSAPESIGDAVWYFDSVRHELVYRVRYASHFRSESESGPANEVRYRVEVVRAANGAYRGVKLEPTAPYHWDPGS